MLFHVGALWRLNQLGYLARLSRISSVSGGSITAAVLAMHWTSLAFNQGGVGESFEDQVSHPIRKLASVTVDIPAVGIGLLPGVSISDRVAAAYRKHLFGRKTLQDLPDEGPGTPRFVFNATNVQSGALWRFSKPYMADWRVGRVEKPKTELAVAVAASSAFPPVLSPTRLKLGPGECKDQRGADLHRSPYTTDVVLSDGGVYDNLGLETAWKNYRTVLVSDGGGKMSPEPIPHGDWGRHAKRVLDLVDNQVRSLRKRQLIASYQLASNDAFHRSGTYWGIRSDVADYKLSAPPGYPFSPAALPHEKTLQLANIDTRLKALDEATQNRLINWGYAICDVALRRHMPGEPTPESRFPCPGGIG